MKPKSNNKALIGFAAIGIGFAAVFTLTSSGSSSTSTTAHHTGTTTSVVVGDDQYTDADKKAVFPKLDTTPPDMFRPLVYHVTGGGSTQPNAIPPDYTGGEAGWAFTGIVAIDGAQQASFENDKTGEFAEVSAGQHWKGCSIASIGADTVTLNGMDGSKTIPLPTEVPTAQQPQPANNAPLNPALNGMIGAMDPAAATADDGTATIDMGGGQGQGFGGRRNRGRGGRGGGGGGRGGRGGGVGRVQSDGG